MSSHPREFTEGQNNERKLKKMKTKMLSKILLSVGLVLVLGSAITQVRGGENMPVITIHSTGDVARGKIGSFVLDMKPALMFGATFVNFKVSGTAIAGVDYVALVSPAYIGQSGYGTILVQTLPDPRGSANRQSYSVVVTLEAGLGYALGAPSSATMWIKP
jgi:hypothetical protein